MSEKKRDITTAGSDWILQRRSTGISGPSREVSQCDYALSGAVCAGQDNDELRWAQKHVPEEGTKSHAKGSVFRKTELHNASHAAEDAARTRKRVSRELDNPTSGLTLRPYETAFRDLICSIIGHQDIAEEKLFLDIADLQQQIAELRQQVGMLEQKVGAMTPAVPEQTLPGNNPEGYV